VLFACSHPLPADNGDPPPTRTKHATLLSVLVIAAAAAAAVLFPAHQRTLAAALSLDKR